MDVTSGFYRGTHILCFVVDAMNKESLAYFPRLLEDPQLIICSKTAIKALLLNKTDGDASRRAVSLQEAQDVAETKGFARENVFEVSAKTGAGIDSAFQELVRQYVASLPSSSPRSSSSPSSQSLIISSSSSSPKHSCCSIL